MATFRVTCTTTDRAPFQAAIQAEDGSDAKKKAESLFPGYSVVLVERVDSQHDMAILQAALHRLNEQVSKMASRQVTSWSIFLNLLGFLFFLLIGLGILAAIEHAMA